MSGRAADLHLSKARQNAHRHFFFTAEAALAPVYGSAPVER